MALNNIFVDHGYEADEATIYALRSDVARIIRKATDGLRQKDAARKLNIAQGDLSKIRNGHIDALSIERLIRLCVRLGIDCAAQWGASPQLAIAVRGHAAELASACSDAVVNDVPLGEMTSTTSITWMPTGQQAPGAAAPWQD